MKVYIVDRRDCDDVFLVGVFSSHDKARKFCVREFGVEYENMPLNYSVTISEATVDEEA